jgi:hypothetical protein
MEDTAIHAPGSADSGPRPVKWTRRGLLSGLAGLAGAIGFRFAFPGTASAANAALPPAGRSTLSDSDLRIAALASELSTNHPQEADRITRWVESQLPAMPRFSRPHRCARQVREVLLEPSRVNREFEREDVMILDGWVLSRSEGAAAIYLNLLAQSSGQIPVR